MSFATVAKAAGSAPGYYNATESSWGGFPIKDAEGKWSLIHAQMANHCPLGSWTSNSIVARSVSTSGKPEGPYSFAEELLPPFAHNPTVRKAEDGTYVIFFIGNTPPFFFSLAHVPFSRVTSARECWLAGCAGGWPTNVSTCHAEDEAILGDDHHDRPEPEAPPAKCTGAAALSRFPLPFRIL